MKHLGLLILLAMLAGCANRYQITLQNGNTMTTSSRPKLNEDKTAFEFKDGRGTRTTVPVFRVKEIAPL